MDSQTLAWIIALFSVALLAAGLTLWLLSSPRLRRHSASHRRELPQDWPLAARGVFSSDERHVYRELKEALPHHVVLSKLPLVRFCQPDDPLQTRYWYELLGATHVSFAVCSPNGRVLAAVDLDSERGSSKRSVMIKQAVLTACRVRYLRCGARELPTVAELQLLVPQSSASPRAPQPAPAPPVWHGIDDDDIVPLPKATLPKSRERAVLWQESSLFQDSFFAPDSRPESAPGAFDDQPVSTRR